MLFLISFILLLLVKDSYQQEQCNQEITKALLNLEKVLGKKLENLLDAFENEIKDKFSDLEVKLNSTMDQIIITKLIVIKYQGCPTGSGWFSEGGQCYRFFNDVQRSWSAARSKCEEEGLILAQPNNPDAVKRYIIHTYGGSANSWIGGKSDGLVVRWVEGDDIIPESDPNWNNYNAADGQCLAMLTHKVNLNSRPYNSLPCTSTRWTLWTLCEVSLN